MRELRAGTCCATAAGLHGKWKLQARGAKTNRTVIGALAMAYGLTNLTLGVVALAADDPNFTEPERGNLAAFLFVTGGRRPLGLALRSS